MIDATVPSQDVPGSGEIGLHTKLESAFNALFLPTYGTRLVGGADEPLYLPAKHGKPHTIYYRDDYTSSALHECAHWCIAGPERRQLEDYGYWYAPDGRSREQQQHFEQAEVKPQALEWLLAKACGLPFRLSADNLEQGSAPSDEFRSNVHAQALRYCSSGLPERADMLVDNLSVLFSTSPKCPSNYTLHALY